MLTRIPVLLAVASLLTPFDASAQAVWRWTDARGDVHYTDDPGNIPERYRKGAKKTRGDDLGQLGSPDRGSKHSPSETHVELGEQSRARDEAQWRARFRSARERIAQLEQSRGALQKRVNDPAGSGVPVFIDANGITRPSPELERTRARLAEVEAELAQAREDLADLERQAARSAVPLEWRR